MHFFNFRTLTSVCLLSVLLFAGCKKHKPDEPEKLSPKLSLESATMDVSADGGVFQMKYTLENPVEGEKVSVNCSESWISGIDAATPGVISFKVAVNEADAAREAVVSVSYAGIDPVPSFKVRQAAAEEVPAPEIKIAQAQVSVPAEGASGCLFRAIVGHRFR